MINLSNERTNFTFTGSEGNYNFEGSCVYLGGDVLEMNAIITLANEETPDSSINPSPTGNSIGSVNYNCPSGDASQRANLSVNVVKEHREGVYTAAIAILSQLEEAK